MKKTKRRPGTISKLDKLCVLGRGCVQTQMHRCPNPDLNRNSRTYLVSACPYVLILMNPYVDCVPGVGLIQKLSLICSENIGAYRLAFDVAMSQSDHTLNDNIPIILDIYLNVLFRQLTQADNFQTSSTRVVI